MADGIFTPYVSHAFDRVHQGDIVRGLPVVTEIFDPANVDEPSAEIETVEYSVVLTQECDLEQDHKLRIGDNTMRADKEIFEIFLAKGEKAHKRRSFAELMKVLLARAASAFRARHTSFGKDRWLDSTRWKNIVNNKDERFHFLEGKDGFEDGLLIDFKHVFSVNSNYLCQVLKQSPSRFLWSMSVPYREHLSTRFAYYASRVALPVDHRDDLKADKSKIFPYPPFEIKSRIGDS